MHSIDSSQKKYVLRFFKILVFILSVIMVGYLLDFAFVPVSYFHWVKHYRDQLSGKIDTLIIGDSLPMYAVQPTVLDNEFGCTSFNASSASQHLEDTFYLLQDYIKSENLKTVFFGIDYYNFLKSSEINGVAETQQVFKRIKDPKIKFRYIKGKLNGSNISEWLFPVRIHREDFWNCRKNIAAKLTHEYRNYLILSDERYLLEAGTYYYDKGYVFTKRVNDSYVEGNCDMNEMTGTQITMFKNIIQLCLDNNIKINVFHSPIKVQRKANINNYDYFIDAMKKIAAEMNFDFYDFNSYCAYSVLDDSCFVNVAHLNYKGSCIFMEWLCKTYLSTYEDRNRLFE